MTKADRLAKYRREYLPKPNDPVVVKSVLGRLVVMSVDKRKRTALVGTTSAPVYTFTVEWSQISRLDRSQNAAPFGTRFQTAPLPDSYGS
jgi:hypothetical protein